VRFGRQWRQQGSPGHAYSLMLKLVLDTHVFVSALINPHGKSARIFDHILKNGIRLFTSPAVAEERERVLRHPKLAKRHGLQGEELSEFIADLPVISSLIEERKAVEATKTHRWHNNYLSCAISGRADFIVSAESSLLQLKEYEGTQITTPDQLAKLFENGW